MKPTVLIRIILVLGLAGWAVASYLRRKSVENVFSGTLEYTQHSVGARAAGRVVRAAFEEGQEVRRGESLAVLDRYDQAKRDLERAERLLKHGGSSRQAVEQATLALEDQEVLSPVDGVVLVKVREEGEIVPAGGTVAVLGESGSPWVRIYVPEGRLASVKTGMAAGLSFDGIPRRLKGHVELVAPRAEYTPRNVQTPEERATQTFAVKVALDERDPLLKPGLAADVTLGGP